MPRRDIVAGQFVRPEKAEAARRLRRDDTPAERALWACLRGHRLAGFKFRRQQVISGFLADFYCAEAGLIVELDGAVHAAQTVADAGRDRVLTDRGLRVVRFKSDQIESNLHEVLRDLETALRGRSSPTPGTEASPAVPPLSVSERGPGGGVALAFLLLFAAPTPAAPLEAGFASADITPALTNGPVYLAGFGPNRPAKSVHDPLMVRAVALRDGPQTVALASVDVVGLFLPVIERCRQRLPKVTHLTVSATHNHEGPDTLGLWGRTPLASGVDPAYLKRVEDAVVGAVGAAVRDLKPCHAEIGTVRAPELLTDNRLPVVKLDALVALRLIDIATGKSRGVVVQWHAHPETLGSANTAVSADFVGHAVRALAKSQGCPVVYLSGAVGGLMTSLKVPVADAAGQMLDDGTHEKTSRYGELVAAKAAEALSAAVPATLTPFVIRTTPVRVEVQNPLYKLAWQLKVFDRPAFTYDPAHPDAGLPTTAITKPTALGSEVGYLRLGELGVALIPGEIYPELVLNKVVTPAEPGADFPDAPAEPAIYPAMPTRFKMLIGLANDELGYLIPRRQWDAAKPHCYGLAKPQYGEQNSVGPDAARVICEAFARLTR